jgi:hypothetical protein
MVKQIVLFYSDARKPSKKQVAVAEFIIKHKKLLASQEVYISAFTITPSMLKDPRIQDMMKSRNIKSLPVLITPKRHYYERVDEKVTILEYYKSLVNVIESDTSNVREEQPQRQEPDRDGDEVEQFYRSVMADRSGEDDDSDERNDMAPDMDKLFKRAAEVTKHREKTLKIKSRHRHEQKERKRRRDDSDDEDDDDRKQQFNTRHGEQDTRGETDSMSREDNIGSVGKYLDDLDADTGNAEEFAKSELSKAKNIKVDQDDETMMLQKLGLL